MSVALNLTTVATALGGGAGSALLAAAIAPRLPVVTAISAAIGLVVTLVAAPRLDKHAPERASVRPK